MAAAGVPVSALGTTLVRTVRQLRLPVITIAFILSIATVMNYSGMTSSMALALAKTGVLFPFFSAWLGMIGVFLTGSDTSSNTLFGPLQATTAKLSGLDPVLMAATNSSAGVMGKMISPQNLSVGAAGVGAVGREGEILAKVIVHSLFLTTLMGIVAMRRRMRSCRDGSQAVTSRRWRWLAVRVRGRGLVRRRAAAATAGRSREPGTRRVARNLVIGVWRARRPASEWPVVAPVQPGRRTEAEARTFPRLQCRGRCGWSSGSCCSTNAVFVA